VIGISTSPKGGISETFRFKRSGLKLSEETRRLLFRDTEFPIFLTTMDDDIGKPAV